MNEFLSDSIPGLAMRKPTFSSHRLRRLLGALRVPPHVAWPAFVVGILMMSVGFVVFTVIAANSDGGAQVVADYHAGGGWDEQVALQAASDRLSWTADVAVEAPIENGLRPVEIVVRDGDGQPVEGLEGTVRLGRPHRAAAVAELPLRPQPGQPGAYQVLAPIRTSGLWDVHLDATRGADRFLAQVRKDVRASDE